MQNFFLHEGLRPAAAGGREAHDVLVEKAIPACREAGMDVVFLNWGLTQEEIDAMPASLRHNFSRSLTNAPTPPAAGDVANAGAGAGSKGSGVVVGMGEDMGEIKEADGTTVAGGRELMRDQWNTKLWNKLDAVWREAQQSPGALKEKTFWVHKNRASGLSVGSGLSAMSEHLAKKSGGKATTTKTLLFAGVNTDQCVYGTFIDAVTLGYDCILLSDCCATTSPEYCTQMVHFNAARNGFVTTADELRRAVKEQAA